MKGFGEKNQSKQIKNKKNEGILNIDRLINKEQHQYHFQSIKDVAPEFFCNNQIHFYINYLQLYLR